METTEERVAALKGEQPPEHRKPEANGSDPIESVDPGVPAGSLLDQLVKQRDEIAQETTTDFVIPNNGGVLMARYRLLPWRQVRKFADVAMSRKPEAELNAATDMIASACIELWLRDPETGERQLWPNRSEDMPLKFEPELLRFLRIDAPAGAQTREIIRLVFQRDLAVTAHQQRLVRWMEGASEGALEAFAGG